MATIVVTAPDPVVSWAEAKAHLRLDGDDEQAYVETLVAAAQGVIDGPDGWLGRAIGHQTLESSFPGFCPDLDLMPTTPSVDSVRYIDPTGEEVFLDEAAYRVIGTPSRPRLALVRGHQWPTTGDDEAAVRVRYTAGYTVVPAPIKQAILLWVGQWFENRENASGIKVEQMPDASEWLLSPFRVYR